MAQVLKRNNRDVEHDWASLLWLGSLKWMQRNCSHMRMLCFLLYCCQSKSLQFLSFSKHIHWCTFFRFLLILFIFLSFLLNTFMDMLIFIMILFLSLYDSFIFSLLAFRNVCMCACVYITQSHGNIWAWTAAEDHIRSYHGLGLHWCLQPVLPPKATGLPASRLPSKAMSILKVILLPGTLP